MVLSTIQGKNDRNFFFTYFSNFGASLVPVEANTYYGDSLVL